MLLAKTAKNGEPLVATMMIGGLSTLVVVVSVLGLGISNAFAVVSVITGIFWLTGRIVDGFGVPVFYYRIGQLSWNTLFIPLIATALNVWGVGESLSSPDLFTIYTLVAILLVIGAWYF